jgi:hypothetical protein
MSTLRIALTSGLAASLVVILALGGIVYGQSTRQSDDDVATLVSQKVRAEDRSSDRAQAKALKEQDAKYQTRVKRLNRKHLATLKEQKDSAYQDGQSTGYTSGYSSGNTEGFSQGHETGLVDGSDSLDCSDDPDVYWLPACY